MVCDVLVLHGCLVVLSILSLLLFFLGGEWGVEGEAACSQGHAFVCACVCCGRGEERKRKRGGRWQQARPAKGERERGRKGGGK